MVATTPRFTTKTLGSLVGLLQARHAALAHSAEALRQEVAEANSKRDMSDLLDSQDPSADSDTETIRALARRAEALLREVEDALQRVSAGTYGYCTTCGRGVSLVRLRALPATSWCIRCSSSPSGDDFDQGVLGKDRQVVLEAAQ